MKLYLFHKLFLGLIITTSTIVIAMLILMRWSFDRGFLNYVYQQDIEKVAELQANLLQHYQEYGNWEFLRNNHYLWQQYLYSHQIVPYPPTAILPHQLYLRNQTPNTSQDAFHLAKRLVIFDQHKEWVIGILKQTQEVAIQPIKYNKNIIGWLGITPLKSVDSSLEVKFLEEQSKTFYLIAIIMIIFAGLVSFLLTRHFLIPLQSLAEGAHALAKGNFSTRVPVYREDELGQLSKDFNTLAYTLEANESARRNFMADISHELRTPLAILQGEIEALQDKIRPVNQETLHSLHKETLQLNKLVEDFYQLALSDIGALTYKKSEQNLIDILEEVLDNFKYRFVKAKLSLKTNLHQYEEIILLADTNRLIQLFTNLLENSIRYTDANGIISIDIEHKDRWVMLSLQDSMPAVPEHALPKLFDKLYRVEASRNRAKGGAGLGLAICRNIVIAHEGTIRAFHSPLGGLWVQIQLPTLKT